MILQIMNRFVEPAEQLIFEIYSRDLKKSIQFYSSLGFAIVREEPDFAELRWEDSRLYIEQSIDPTSGSSQLAGNIRVMVPDVDRYWNTVKSLGTRIVKEIEDREYGLRDFTIAGPDGVGLRFGTRISK
jgi:catechol 2,3-dioxygenase-like lactoylglutathione lyase family enzyme